MSDQPKLIYGAGDLLTSLEETRERITNGELEAIVILEIPADGIPYQRVSWIDDMKFHYERIVAAMGDLLAKTHREGLEDEK